MENWWIVVSKLAAEPLHDTDDKQVFVFSTKESAVSYVVDILGMAEDNFNFWELKGV